MHVQPRQRSVLVSGDKSAIMLQFLKFLVITVIILPVLNCLNVWNASDPVMNHQSGDPRVCLKHYTTIKRFEVFPGTGWDNLRNMDAGNVMVYNYSLCKTTLDGRFLIPDDVETRPRKSSKLNTFAQVISHYTDYTSITANSINVHAGGSFGGIGVSGSFSHNYQQAKGAQIRDRSVTTRVDVRYVRYTANLKTIFKLDPDFKTKLADIAASIDGNKTNEAMYRSQILIRDYGTHYLTSVEVGAVLVQEDQISSDYLSSDDSTVTDMKVAAGVSFLNMFNFGMSYETLSSKSNTEKYQQQRLSSKILTFGGPQFMTHNFTINDWANNVDDNMVAVDRHGDPLDYLITEANLPDMSGTQVNSLRNLVVQAINLYYKENTYTGCTKLDSPNFSSAANIDDGSCVSPTKSTIFGGVFQTCDLDSRSNDGDICKENEMNKKNHLTGDYTCPDGYESVKIHSATLSTRKPNPDCIICDSEFFFCCQNEDYYKYKLSSATYSLYWCAAADNVPQKSGYLFGGTFTSKKINPLTQNKSCPISFFPQKLGTDLEVCLGADYEAGIKYAQKFGGLFSCETGNPLAVDKNKRETDSTSSPTSSQSSSTPSPNWPKQCAEGYNEHLAYVDQECQISYCFKSVNYADDLPKIKRPPFATYPNA